MEENGNFDEDHLTDYEIQLSIQESIEANKQELYPERFVPLSAQNRKLVEAIKKGQILELQDYVKYKYALDEADENGWFPLHEAAVQPIQQILEIVLDASYKSLWEYNTCDGETPLTLAVNSCLVENVRTLLEKGVCPDTKNLKGETPLLLAIRKGSYDMVSLLIKHNTSLDVPCIKKWSAMHEAAKQGRKDIVALLLKNGGNVHLQDGFGITPLGVAAEYGHCDVLEHLIHKGGDVFALSDDGASVLFEAAGGGNPDCISLLLEYGGSGNVPNRSGHLPIHRAAYEGHYLALKFLIPVTSKNAIQKSGLTPIHSAAEGQNVQCLELLIENDFDVNSPLADHISENYDDGRKTALYFAVSNNDIRCTEVLLAAGADPNQDPLNCLLVAVRAGNYEIVRLLLSHGANVNCYFMHVNDTRFPSAIQYALNDEAMLRLLLNNGYQVEMCFDCMHGDIFGNSFVWSEIEEDVLPGWTSCVIKDNPFCEFITVPWMKHLVGSVIRILIDYMDYVPLCEKLKSTLEVQKEWPEIRQILENPCSLMHLCRLRIRRLMGLKRLCKPEFIEKLPLPTILREYILFKEYDLYGQELGLS
ncbi:ankyrin repeat and SOCS box protein 15 isoform X3 [Dromiciops gliroides]|nr:ankyrin repeat and SOCS box protein 15 isoform X3 [Dromiciops gliroides]XP_043821991.1 ankyrin repeat and SOCS box protein 15 isoform X3 [Dromiciops gliroides]XP_043821992.1 ankyrin repeat and SOCS box protein 15 isoform X3 [Dromiciops gliroides]XP_043821993.1 ankyrin repeat and SOCS box protein 15 isoform X3 [Dromiciops gliroides]XP_043821994.1 ankyrin repeat and SOCS box protein 15 isoform X3 [Dromiciops gliroides]XP_043821995.1 ankyrin repeat and SOCS box protein 15 isoform X3 [Dromiciop